MGEGLIVGTVPLPAERTGRIRASKRLLALAGDERLVAEIREGNEAAFEVAYERHGKGVLSFCRHMLGSPEEAEEAVQHSFAAAWTDLQRSRRPVRLKPWLYTIARNRCLSLLRARRERPAELQDLPATTGLAEEVAQRADLKALLGDLLDLPEEQRAALVLSELGGFSHADIAHVVGRREADVKAIVFRARSTLAAWREARETPCDEIREQLSVLSGGSLRRRTLRRHLQECPGCREFREQIKTQRRMMALILPVMPSVGLKRGVLMTAGLGGGAAGGGAAAGGAAGLGAAGSLGGATVAKVAVLVVAAGGAITAGERALDGDENVSRSPATPAAAPSTSSPAGDGAITPSIEAGGPAARKPAGNESAPGPRRGTARRGGRKGGAGEGGGASTLAPPATPVRARGEPPALGRVRRGLSPPQTGPKDNNGRAIGKGRDGGAAPKAKAKEPKPQEVKPEPKPKPVRPETPAAAPKGKKQAE